MLAAPWYLSSLGILIIVLGLIGSLASGGRHASAEIDPRMSDAEIARRLKQRNAIGWPGLLAYAGLLCVSVGLGWRALRVFV